MSGLEPPTRLSERPSGSCGAAEPPVAPLLRRATEPVRLTVVSGNILIFKATVPCVVADRAVEDVPDEPARLLRSLTPEARAVYILGTPAERAPPVLSVLPGCIALRMDFYRRSYIEIGPSFEEYTRRFSARTRNQNKRKVRKLFDANGGSPFCREFRRAEEMEEFHRIASAVSATSYQERLLHYGIETSLRFRAALTEEARRGGIRAYVLYCRGQPIAYAYLRVWGDVAVCMKCGYDPSYVHYSPGTVLRLFFLERLFSEGRFKRLDFGPGEFDYKEHESTGARQCVDMLYFRRSLRNWAIALVYAGVRTGAVVVRRIAERAGIKERWKGAVARLLMEKPSTRQQRDPPLA